MSIPVCECCEESLIESMDSPVKDDTGDIFCSEDCLEKYHGVGLEEISYSEVSADEIINKYN